MANVINRTTMEMRFSINTPDFPEPDWMIINGKTIPLCAQKYMKIVDDEVLEMTPEEKAVVDYVEPPPIPTVPEARVTRQNEIKSECTQHILASYPLEVQSSCSLGLYSTEVITTIKTFIANCIIEENARYDEIELLTTLEEIAAVTATFPVE